MGTGSREMRHKPGARHAGVSGGQRQPQPGLCDRQRPAALRQNEPQLALTISSHLGEANICLCTARGIFFRSTAGNSIANWMTSHIAIGAEKYTSIFTGEGHLRADRAIRVPHPD